MNKLLWVSLLLCAATASGQETPGVARAAALFAQAEREWRQEHAALALQLFQQSYDVLDAERPPYERRYYVLYNVGVAHERLGNWGEAARVYQQFLSMAPPNAEHRADVESSLEELRTRGVLQREALAQPPDPAFMAIGLAAAGVGAIGLGIAWAYYVDLQSKNSALAMSDARTDGYLRIQSGIDDDETAIAIASLSGAAVLSAGLPLFLPRERGIAWWSWAAGGIALALTGVGVGLELATGDCIGQGCARHFQLPTLGTLLLAHAAPLWSAFATGLLSGLLGEASASAWITPTSGGLALAWRTP